jgi:leucyl aminopeptidase
MTIALIKKLGLMPPNELTPVVLAEQFKEKTYAFTSSTELVGLSAVGRSKAWLGYSRVGKGTNGVNIAIVGKGITFDSGGISIKPSNNMHHMKMDMLGAATVLATAPALNKLDGTFHLYGCCAENTFHHDQMRPGDVITYPNGTKVEILDTDAEGRLVLADGILAAKKHNPDLIITIATLTGSARAALGNGTAVFGSQETVDNLLASAKECQEDAWQLPIWKQHRENIKGQKGVSDIKNLGTIAGASTAAAFLEHFVGDTPWIHLDIAGSAYTKSGVPTGAMYKTLLKYLGA